MQLLPISKIKLKYKCIMCYTCICTKPVLQAVWLLSDCMLATWRGGGGVGVVSMIHKRILQKIVCPWFNLILLHQNSVSLYLCICVPLYLCISVFPHLRISLSLYLFILYSCTGACDQLRCLRRTGGLELSLLGRTCFHRSCIRWTALYRVAYRVLCPPTMYSGSRVRLRFRSLPSGPVEALINAGSQNC